MAAPVRRPFFFIGKPWEPHYAELRTISNVLFKVGVHVYTVTHLKNAEAMCKGQGFRIRRGAGATFLSHVAILRHQVGPMAPPRGFLRARKGNFG